MKIYKMEIVLLSDLCISDGSSYNSMVDTEICTDRMGFPVIPAKRLRGCLKECGEELRDWGFEIPLERMFGREGNQSGTIRIGNAHLAGKEDYLKEVQTYEGTILTHPQNILREFSYLRAQTAIDYETGAAKDQSLRVMRVVNKGLHFISEVTMPDQDAPFLEKCCTILKHMGTARTRGLGDVTVTLTEQEQQESHVELCPWKEHAVILEYELMLMEPVLCKAIGGGEERTMDYIDGAKMLGLIAQASKQDGENAFLELMEEGELICSNAYLSEEGQRFTPVPACYYAIKDQKETFIDKSSLQYHVDEKDQRQLHAMKNCYVMEDTDGNLICKTVQTEERYHHRRPDDKSFGHATGNGRDGSVFYQISSICEDQKFRGYIQGSERQIKKVYGYLKNQSQIFMGAGRSSEYGKVHMAVTNLRTRGEGESEYAKTFLVKLESPLILYGKNAAYTIDAEELKKEINAVLQLSEDMIETVDRYMDTTTVGGYQVTWGMKKPVLGAFQMGTVFVYHLNQEIDISCFKRCWIGERVNEGYGEVTVTAVNPGAGERRLLTRKRDTISKKVNIDGARLMIQICSHLFSDYVSTQAVRMADQKEHSWYQKEALKPTVNNMMQMCRDMDSFQLIETECKKRFQEKEGVKEKKADISQEILADCKNTAKVLLIDFLENFQLEGYTCPGNEMEFLFLKCYLQEIRYRLRGEKGGE